MTERASVVLLAAACVGLAPRPVGADAVQTAGSNIVVLVVDDSASMSFAYGQVGTDRIGRAAFAAHQLAGLLPPSTRLAVYTFGSIQAGDRFLSEPAGGIGEAAGGREDSERLLRFLAGNGRHNPDRDPACGAGDSHPYWFGSTPCRNALERVAQDLAELVRQAPARRVSVIVFTDGKCEPAPDQEVPAGLAGQLDQAAGVAGSAGTVRLQLDVVTFPGNQVSQSLVALAGALHGRQYVVDDAAGVLGVLYQFGELLDSAQGIRLTRLVEPTGDLRLPDYSQARTVNLVIVEDCGAAGCPQVETFADLAGVSWTGTWRWPDAASPADLRRCGARDAWPERTWWLYARLDPREQDVAQLLGRLLGSGGRRRAILRADYGDPVLDFVATENRCGEAGGTIQANVTAANVACLEGRVLIPGPAGTAAMVPATVQTLFELYAQDAADGDPIAFIGAGGIFEGDASVGTVSLSAGVKSLAIWRRDVQPMACTDGEQEVRFCMPGTDRCLDRRLCHETCRTDPCNGLDDDEDGLVDEDGPDLDQDGIPDCVDDDRDNDGCNDGVDPDPRTPRVDGTPCLPPAPAWALVDDPPGVGHCHRDPQSGSVIVDFGEIDFFAASAGPAAQAVAVCNVDPYGTNVRPRPAPPAPAARCSELPPAVDTQAVSFQVRLVGAAGGTIAADPAAGTAALLEEGANGCFDLIAPVVGGPVEHTWRPIETFGDVSLPFTLVAHPTCGPLRPDDTVHSFAFQGMLVPVAPSPAGLAPIPVLLKGSFRTSVRMQAVTREVQSVPGSETDRVRLKLRFDSRLGVDPVLVPAEDLELRGLVDTVSRFLPEAEGKRPEQRLVFSDCANRKFAPDQPLSLARPTQELCIDIPDFDRCRERTLFKGLLGIECSAQLTVALRDLRAADQEHALDPAAKDSPPWKASMPLTTKCSTVDWLLWPGWVWLPILLALCIVLGFVRSAFATFGLRHVVVMREAGRMGQDGQFRDPVDARPVTLKLSPPSMGAKPVVPGHRRPLVPFCFYHRRDHYRLQDPGRQIGVVEVRRGGGGVQCRFLCQPFRSEPKAKAEYEKGDWARAPKVETWESLGVGRVFVWVKQPDGGAILYEVATRS